MSDFNSSLPVRTQTNGDVVAFIADGTTNTQLLGVDSAGRITIKLDDGVGNAINSQTISSSQWLQVVMPANGPASPGTAATNSVLAGGIYNSTPPTLTNGQQSALQLTSSGALVVSATVIFPYDTNYGTVDATTLRVASQIGNATGAANFNFGTVGAQTLRTASQIGNATGAADFGAGATDAQTLRVTANLSDGSGNAISSTGGALNVSAIQSGTWTVQQGSAPWSFTGTLTNNNAAPAANNFGALIALAEGTLSATRYTTGDQVLLVTDLAGNTNVDLQYYLGAAVSKTNPIMTTISDGTNSITAAISAYGTAPTGTEVMGVNAYITNTPTVNQGTSPWIVKDQADGSVTGGTAGSFSMLAGGIYNSTPPTLTTGQQASLQLDSAGRLLVDANITFPYDTNYGTVDASTLRTASQIGNATGAANFNYGTVGAQTLRTASQIGNATGAADFGAGATDAQTLRVTANLSDGSGNSLSSTSGALNVAVTQPLPAGTNLIGAVNLDVGSSPVSTTNPVPVTIVDSVPGTPIQNYQTFAALAAGATYTFTYTVVASHTFTLQRVWSTASGKIKSLVQNNGTTIFVGFNSTANPNIDMTLMTPPTIAAGNTVTVAITNNDLLPFDVYVTIEGNQN